MPCPTHNPAQPQPTATNHPTPAPDPRPESTHTPEFLEECRRQCRALNAHDPGGDEVMRWIEELYEWPEP